MTPQLILAGLAVLAVFGVGGLAFALAGDGGGQAVKRARQLETSGSAKAAPRKGDINEKRRKQTQAMLTELRAQNKQRRQSIVPQDIASKIAQAGLSIPASTFWIVSVVVGLAAAGGVYLSGADGLTLMGIELRSRIAVIAGAGLAGTFGLPRWLLGMLAKSRNKKMTNQFADAIDVIVRGVKSGLPLTECLRIIARESPAPLGEEFHRLTDNIQMGTAIETSLQRFYRRVPLPEVNFFVIVLTIQSKSGGNLSEALGNLSAVIRQRKMMREKVKALSSEAKASAMIIGCLPFAVATMVYLTTPDYIMKLFTTSAGHNILAIAAIMMITGITVMRNMINFDI